MSGISDNHPIWGSIQVMERDTPPPWISHAKSILSGIESGRTYSLGEIRRICGDEVTNAEIIPACTFLGSARGAVFDAELFIKDDTGRHVLTPKQVDLVFSDKELQHPVTGEMIPDPAKVTYIAYKCR